ncbi:MAG: hypothetical protein M1816_006825 [Peltula sp. TS41687]|nr:MAG: hypothetical protein M1816_006825 [Peltula sp. TS41687]
MRLFKPFFGALLLARVEALPLRERMIESVDGAGKNTLTLLAAHPSQSTPILIKSRYAVAGEYPPDRDDTSTDGYNPIEADLTSRSAWKRSTHGGENQQGQDDTGDDVSDRDTGEEVEEVSPFEGFSFQTADDQMKEVDSASSKVEKSRKTRAQKTPEEIAADKAARAEKMRQIKAQRTPEQKAATAEKIRQAKLQRSPKQKAVEDGAKAEKVRQAWAQRTEEEKAAIAEKTRQVKAQKSPEEKEATLEKLRRAKKEKSPEEKAAISEKLRQAHAEKSPEQKAAALEKMREAKMRKSPEEQAAVLERMRQGKAQMSPDQKSAASEKLKQAHAQRKPKKKAETSVKLSHAHAQKSPEEKQADSEIMSERMKRYWARKRLEKESAESAGMTEGTKGLNDESGGENDLPPNNHFSVVINKLGSIIGDVWKKDLSKSRGFSLFQRLSSRLAQIHPDGRSFPVISSSSVLAL